MQKLNIKFENTGNVLSVSKWCHPRLICNHENQIMDAEAYVASLGKSPRKASAELGISQRSVQGMLKKFKLKPYLSSLLQALHEYDADRQLELHKTIIIREEADQNFLGSILCSNFVSLKDEACFKLYGRVIDIIAYTGQM